MRSSDSERTRRRTGFAPPSARAPTRPLVPASSGSWGPAHSQALHDLPGPWSSHTGYSRNGYGQPPDRSRGGASGLDASQPPDQALSRRRVPVIWPRFRPPGSMRERHPGSLYGATPRPATASPDVTFRRPVGHGRGLCATLRGRGSRRPGELAADTLQAHVRTAQALLDGVMPPALSPIHCRWRAAARHAGVHPRRARAPPDRLGIDDGRHRPPARGDRRVVHPPVSPARLIPPPRCCRPTDRARRFLACAARGRLASSALVAPGTCSTRSTWAPRRWRARSRSS